MIEEQAIVVKSEGKYIWVQTQRQSSCGHCSVKNGCGTQVLSKVLGNKATLVRCVNAIHDNSENKTPVLKAGDMVMVGIQESTLLSGSLLIYLLPLVFMILMGGLAVFISQFVWLEGKDLLSILFSVFGLFIGLSLSKAYLHKSLLQNSDSTFQNCNLNQFEPIVLKKLSSKSQPVIMMMP